MALYNAHDQRLVCQYPLIEILTTRSLVPGGRPRALPRLGCLQHESKSAGVDAPRALTLLSLGHMPSPCLHVSGCCRYRNSPDQVERKYSQKNRKVFAEPRANIAR